MPIPRDSRCWLSSPIVLLSILFLSGLLPPAAVAQEDAVDLDAVAVRSEAPVAVLVELSEPPAAVVYGNELRQNAALPLNVARAVAATAARVQIQAVRVQQARFDAALAALPFERTEIYRVSKAFNGIAFQVDAARMDDLRRLPGVRAVRLLEPEYPTNSTSVPFLGAQNIWGNTLSLPQGYTGSGVTVGIIDTGIDYQHANFGGTGALADYQANDRTIAEAGGAAAFPTAKVVGGTDFAGDAYNGSNVPAPDPDPMDCNGHGSHVSGSAAGYGVTAAGTTFAGPYDAGVPFASLRIGPGTAPQANLYALRVFGCGGSTNLTVQAIDWSMDPNDDNDLSDHLDVINMSLGSNFGRPGGASAVAAQNAAAAGVIVVASAGNAGDTFFINGSPGIAGRAVSVANIGDPGVAGAVLVINSPAGIAGNHAASTANSFAPTPAPAPTGQTATIVLADDPANGAGPLTTDGCSPLTNAAAIAGNIALVDRGTCGFQTKANNAQAAGAIGVIIGNNIPGDPDNFPVMGATGAVPVTIPTVIISQANRDTIVGQLPGVNGTLGAATAADTIATSSSRGPRLAASPIRLKPDIAAPGTSITSTQTGVTCTPGGGCLVSNATGFIPDSQSLTISGTSMASPHVAGIMALLRQEHPEWSVEQLKALAMNGALHDVTIGNNGSGPRLGPGRIGAGRVDPGNSARAEVVALNADDTGLVSVSFETTHVVGSATEVKTVRLLNTGASSATYDLAIDSQLDAPGIAFSLPGGGSVTVPAGETVEIDVQMDANAALMDHVREASMSPVQTAAGALASLGNQDRHWMTQEGGYLVLSQSGVPMLRLPLYLASRPASNMSAPATITTGGAPTGSTTIPLSGADVCSGTLGAGPVCTGTFPADEVSLVTPFELQAVSPRDDSVAPAYADLQYAGVAYNAAANVILFGVSTWSPWSSPTDVSFSIYIDVNEDGTWDRILFNSDGGTENVIFGVSANSQDTFITSVLNIATSGVSVPSVATGRYVNRLSSASFDSALFDNNVMFIGAAPATLGIPGGDTTFRWKVVTCPGFAPLCAQLFGFQYDEAPGPFFWNYAAQGLDFGGLHLAQDLNGATLPVTWSTANMTTNGSLGALLLHHHNEPGPTAEAIVLEGTPTADLSIAKSVAPPVPSLGQNVTFTLTVANNGPDAAAGVQVTDLLPPGLTYVSDNGGGAFDPVLGTWTVGALAVSASASLQIVATVDSTDEACNLAQITAGTPLDPNPANNQSAVCVLAPRSADLDLSMSVSSPTVLVGNSVTFTITATNNGEDTAYSVDVQEAFPSFPLLNPASFTASQGSYDPNTGLWNLASLGLGFSATLDIDVTAPNTAGALTNQGTASAGTGDPDNANNTASATTTVLSPASIAATKTVSGTFAEGGAITYTIVLSNSSAYDQQNNSDPELTDVLPAQVTLVSASATAGTAVATIATNTVTWDGVIPANGSVTITIQATVNAGTALQTVSNQATVNYDQDGNGLNEAAAATDDPAAGGPTDTTSFVVVSPSSIGTRTKTVTGTFAEGGTVTYTVTISNPSASTQLDNPGDEFTDVLPSTLTLVSASASSGTAVADTGTNTVHWNGSIAASGSVTITITAAINTGSASQSIANQGTIFFDADGNGTNEASALTDDPAVGGTDDPTVFAVASVIAIPTLSEIGLMVMGLLLAFGALVALRLRP